MAATRTEAERNTLSERLLDLQARSSGSTDGWTAAMCNAVRFSHSLDDLARRSRNSPATAQDPAISQWLCCGKNHVTLAPETMLSRSAPTSWMDPACRRRFSKRQGRRGRSPHPHVRCSPRQWQHCCMSAAMFPFAASARHVRVEALVIRAHTQHWRRKLLLCLWISVVCRCKGSMCRGDGHGGHRALSHGACTSPTNDEHWVVRSLATHPAGGDGSAGGARGANGGRDARGARGRAPRGVSGKLADRHRGPHGDVLCGAVA